MSTTEIGSDNDIPNGKEDGDVVSPGEDDDERAAFQQFDHSAMQIQSMMSSIKREKWGSNTQFLMSCIASAVGLGNVWRFPAICAKWGGASFFIPYMVVLFLVARPLFLLELALGQFSSKGSVRCWDLSPAFIGVGYAGSISSVLLSTFYILLMAWALIYSFISFVSMCGGEVLWGSASGPYFGGEVLQAISFDDPKTSEFSTWVPVCHLVLALLVSWLIIWGTMVGGVEASGKVAYVTALAPYVVLIILVAVGCSLEGSLLGLEYFIVPDWTLVLDPRTWFEAVGQCFFSLGIGFGGLIMFSSFNEFHHNIFSDVVVISIVDFVTSVLAGVSLMTILGFQATQSLKKMDRDAIVKLAKDCDVPATMASGDKWLRLCQLREIVKEGGAGLAFVQYPAAMYEINETWGKHLGGFFALLFFLMLILLAVGSANGFVGTTVTIIADRRPDWKRSNIVSGVCGISFFIGLIYTNKVGSDWIDVVDTHGVTAVVYILGFLEAIAVFFVYGLKNFCDDLEFMRNGKAVHWYFKITWVLLPAFMFLVYIVWILNYAKKPHWTIAITVIAWLLTAVCILVIPAIGVYKFFDFKNHPWRRNVNPDVVSLTKAILKPSPRWGPKDPEIRAEWKKFKATRTPTYGLWEKFLKLIKRKTPEPPLGPAESYATYATANYHPNQLNPPEGASNESGLNEVNSGSSSPSATNHAS